jgi:predicted ATPase
LACHQQYLLQQYCAVEPKNKYRCHQNTALNSNNKLPHHYISNNKLCTRYFYQLLYIYTYMHLHMYMCVCICMYVYICMSVTKPMYFVRPKIQLQLKIQSFQFIQLKSSKSSETSKFKMLYSEKPSVAHFVSP